MEGGRRGKRRHGESGVKESVDQATLISKAINRQEKVFKLNGLECVFVVFACFCVCVCGLLLFLLLLLLPLR